MNKLVKYLLTAVAAMCLTGVFMAPESFAATINYKYIDGTVVEKDDGGTMVPVTTDNTVTTTAFTEAETAIGASNIIAYVDADNYFKGVYTPIDTSLASGGTVVVVTTDKVTAGGEIGTHGVKWFIYDNALYLVSQDAGGATLSDESASPSYKGTYNRDISYTGEGFNILTPVLEKGDLGTDGYGMADSTVGDERDFAEDEFYTYTPNPDSEMFSQIGPRDPISFTGFHYSTPSKAGSVLDAGDLPWINYADQIETVYFGTDIDVTGNIAQMFNGQDDSESGSRFPAIIVGNVRESLYSSLQDVFIYSDFSGVTSMAATFARCPELRQVVALNADGTPQTSFDLSALDTSAFMFYGDEKLSNTYNGSLVDIMDLSGGALENTMYMFAGCKNIVSPNIKDYNMSNVVNVDGMFQGAARAAISFQSGGDASVAAWDTGNVKTALCAFAGVIPEGTDGKPNYDNPNRNLSPSLGTIPSNNVVEGIVDLTNLDLSKCVTTYHMFAQNLGVTGVNFDSTANSYDALVDTAGMFNGADNLASVSLTGVDMPSLKYAQAMFRRAGSASGGTADLSNFSADNLEYTDMMFEKSGYATINLNGSSDMSNVKEAIAMFADCNRLTSLGTDALSHFVLSSALDTRYMFNGDKVLTKVDVHGWNMSNVEDINHMFCECEALDTLNSATWTIGTGDSDGDGVYLEDMECFAYDTGISNVSMRDWYTSHVKNMFFAFAANPSLLTVQMPSMANSLATVEDMMGAFSDDPKLTSVAGLDSSKYAAPKLEDARGLFANDVLLTEMGLTNLIQDGADTISYMFRNDRAMTDVDISGFDTKSVRFTQGMFDGCLKLSNIESGANFTINALKDAGIMFKDCYKITSTVINGIIARWTDSAQLTDMYHTFENDYALTSLDLTPLDMSTVTDLRHLAYMEENADITSNKLTEIKVPATIMTATGLVESDTSDGNGNSINMFWVDGDGSSDGDNEEGSADDDLLTTFFVDGEIPGKLAAYNFGGTNGDNDNRSFLVYNGRTINGEDRGTYTFISPSDVGVLDLSVTSTLYKNGTTAGTATYVSPVYAWVKDEIDLPGSSSPYTTDPNAAGTYKATAMLQGLTGSNSEKSATYVLTAYPVYERKIEAKYVGPNIVVGNNYSKGDVQVVYTNTDGTETTLATSDFTVNSLVVPAEGDNTYTVTYDPGTGELTDTITVKGVAAGTPFISATYTGEDILVGDSYLKSDVKVVYTKADGTTTTLGVDDFLVSGYVVTAEGDNTYTATYISTDDGTLTDTFVVKGKKPAAGIDATYTGDTVPVGSNYSKSDVKVVLTLADGTQVTLGVDDFTVDSQKVTKKGDNEFTVTYKNGDETYTDTITVPGKRVIGSIVATYTGPAVLVGNEYSTSDVTVTAYYADDTSKSEGFTVTPSGFSTTKITSVGDNTITATYRDPDQDDKAFTAPFKVNGYKNISSISATYTGDKIKVGDKYEKGKVKVTVYYADGTTGTTENFTVDSLVVTGEGSNSYTATYRDPFGNTYTAGYTVPGYKSSSSSSSSSGTGGSDYAGVSSVYPGTGYAQSLPIGFGNGGVGVTSGIVRTGTTGKAMLYLAAFVALIALIGVAVAFKVKEKDEK